MASQIRSDLNVELNDLKYPDIYVHIACYSHFYKLQGHRNL